MKVVDFSAARASPIANYDSHGATSVPLGFWFAQQGAIVVFVVLVLVYAIAMDRIERRLARGPHSG